MKSAEAHPTPQHVVDAIHIVAKWAREIEAAEVVVSPAGGAAFHPERIADKLLTAWIEERGMLMKAAEQALAILNEWPPSEWGYRETRIADRLSSALAAARGEEGKR